MDTEFDEPLLKASFCTEHDLLLARYQHALEAWAKRREEAWRMGLRGKERSGELMRLQGEFARSYAALHKHSRECSFCRIDKGLSSRDPEPLRISSFRALTE